MAKLFGKNKRGKGNSLLYMGREIRGSVFLRWLDGTMLFKGASILIIQNIGRQFQLYISIRQTK